MLNKNILLYGHEELPPDAIELRAGPLTMIFEPDNAFLRYIRLGDHELVRSIYAVVRDHDWNTIPWQVKHLQTSIQKDSFSITFEVDCADGAVKYFWRGTLSGSADGRLSFSFEGEARSEFRRNRIGICVLHPVTECAGKPCTLEHTTGAIEQTSFPKDIAPWQPLRDVRAITTGVTDDIRAEVRFDGDVFETEDQRNYGDASYKTYSTPQDLPKPVQVKAGDRVSQKVTVTLLNPSRRAVTAVFRASPPHISVAAGMTGAKPAIGLQASRDGTVLGDREAERIRQLQLAHLRGDLTLADSDWPNRLRAFSVEAKKLRLPLFLAIHLGADADSELSELAREAQACAAPVNTWIVYRRGESFPSQSTIDLVRNKLGVGTGTRIAVAASPFFTELNRNRPGPEFNAIACYPNTPQVHLSDRFTVMENAADVAETIATARAFLSQPVIVSPITLRRSEPKTGMKQARAGEEVPNTVDPRQMSVFTAAWTLAHLAHLSTARHLESATYFETVGWRGIMESTAGSPMASKFFSIPGAVFPVYHVFADLADCTQLVPTTCTRPLDAAALTGIGPNKRPRILVANLLPASQDITIGADATEARIRRLNSETAEESMRTPEEFRGAPGTNVSAANGIFTLRLSPYEVVRMDV